MQRRLDESSARVLGLIAVAMSSILCVSCGGGSSGGNNNPPPPAISSLSPNSATAGGPSFTLTVSGANFTSASSVEWNGSPRSTAFVSTSEVTAQIAAADIATGGSVPVTVSNGLAGGTSNSESFSVNNPAPVLSSLNPASSTAGGPAFTLSVSGSGFVSSSVVEWNGANRQTSFVSSSQLNAQITAADIASAGSASVNVFSPTPGGGISAVLTFTISPVGLGGATVISQPSNDLVWDPVHQLIYVSVPSTAGAATGNTITAIDPVTATLKASQFAGSEPDLLAISDDSQFLYVGIDGAASVQRFTLPTLTKDVTISLGADSFFGPYFALDLEVAPGLPHTTAVVRANKNVSPAEQGGIVIYDDATPRPTIAPAGNGLLDSIQWGSDATSVYAANNETTGFDFCTLTVNANGITLTKDYGGAFSNFGIRIHYDKGTSLVYSDDGQVIVPSTGLPAGSFAASGVMIPDSGLNKAFFLGQTQSQVGSNSFTIESFDLTHFTALGSLTISNVAGFPLRLIRWGTNGLAFDTSGGQIIILSGTFVTSTAAHVPQTRVLSEHVQNTWSSKRP